VVTLYGERLIRSLAVVFLDRELAADAAQEAFVQLYLHWDEVTKAGDPKPWLYRVGVNRCKDYRRAMARASRLFQRLSATSAEEAAMPVWTPRAELMSVLRSLPARQRAATVLFYDADLSVAEIAAVLGISTGAVHSHLHRARLALREILEME
jgi:RNA polymerase sigma-70 factor, ECF subfamily